MKLIKALALAFVSSVSTYSLAQGYDSQPEKKTSAVHSCKKDSANLHAKYEISIRRPSNKLDTTSLHLWRNDNKVAHQYPDTNITETWTLVKNRLIKPTRYFDAHQRAIEYQPGETIHGKKETDFSYRYQLISDKLISAMKLESKDGKGCNAVEHYTLQNGHEKFKLSWLPRLKLVEFFSVDRNGYRREWKLANVDFNDDTKSFFSKRQDYQSTDYADIGDDHTDPFLTKMVTQGFIEAGASGYYDEHGHSIGETHVH
jgi:hypothetical protein|tara:strand:+ start:1373 stop:2146 length:774 start_codon:yes stop_codon:yes gene_type:complete